MRCRRCKFGYTGVVDENDPLNLICDYKVKGCDVDVVYGNHPFFTQSNDIYNKY